LALVGPLGIGGVALGTFLAALVSVFWLLPLDVVRQTEGKVKFHARLVVIHAATVLFPALIAVYLLSVYGPSGWSGVSIKAMIIALYLGFSWHISSLDLRRFIWSTSRELLIRLRLRGSKMMGVMI